MQIDYASPMVENACKILTAMKPNVWYTSKELGGGRRSLKKMSIASPGRGNLRYLVDHDFIELQVTTPLEKQKHHFRYRLTQRGERMSGVLTSLGIRKCT